MTDILFTYDLKSGTPDAHKPFLTAAEKQGLLYVIKAGEKVMRLPNTTLWGSFADVDFATAAFNRALAAASSVVGYTIVLEKRVATLLSGAKVRSDVSKALVAKWTHSTSPFQTARLHQLHDPFFK